MFFLDHIYLIPLLPAFGAAIMFFFGRKLQKKTVNAVCVGAVGLAFVFACGAVWQYLGWADANHHQPFEKIVYTWLGTDTGQSNYLTKDGTPTSFGADAGFLLDPLSSIWLLFVTGVGTLIHIYSTGYMAHEGGYYRFFGYLNLFMFSMLTLILANNYVLMSIELILNAVNLNLVALSRYWQGMPLRMGGGPLALHGQVFSIFVITDAAAEAAVGLGILIAFFRNKETVNVDEVNLLKW